MSKIRTKYSQQDIDHATDQAVMIINNTHQSQRLTILCVLFNAPLEIMKKHVLKSEVGPELKKHGNPQNIEGSFDLSLVSWTEVYGHARNLVKEAETSENPYGPRYKDVNVSYGLKERSLRRDILRAKIEAAQNVAACQQQDSVKAKCISIILEGAEELV